MKLYYDLHLHSCLSPCGDNEMTPFNLVNTAKVFGYDLIALTDHNSCRNCRAALEAGKAARLTVVPGMELCTSEEIHVICLFADIDKAEAFGALVHDHLPPVGNRPEIFGDQLVMDGTDTVLDKEPLLLNTASDISIDDVPALVRQYGGACFPAHIDRHSYSILSALGDFSETLDVAAFELTMQADEAHYRGAYPALKNKLLLRDSDAHYLENMLLPSQTIDLPENSAKALVARLARQSSLENPSC